MAWSALENLRLQLNPEAHRPAPKQFRCFILDDESDVRRMISVSLRTTGVQAEEFPTLAEMMAAFDAGHPDLIFLDVWLDGSDAIDAIRVLRERRFEGCIQLMSGRDAELVEPVKRIGEVSNLYMLPVLQKPFRPTDLRNVIHRLNNKFVAGSKSHAPPEFCTDGLNSPKIQLSEALRRNWLELWYQPKLNIQRNRLEGAEGLIRARHPEFGLLLPASFLPDADDASLLELTEFVISKALQDWHVLSQTEYSMRIAVNAPVSALSKLPIPALIRDHAPKTPRWPGLIIEITEDEIVQDIALAHEIATQLKLYNVSLAIDDFGAGYSSFARLRALPFCELKLDRSFVANCSNDRTNESITQTVIDLAHRFGSVAVAEGIENGSDLLALFQMGCDIGQGYHLAPPMPREQLAWTLGPGRHSETAA